MTIIEFFDRDSAIENIVSALLCKPDKVVFIGDSSKKMRKSIEKYKLVTENRGINVVFEAVGVGKNNLMAIVGAIEDVIKENDDCIIDLSGGDDLYLVAVGIIYCDNADKVKLHRFNIYNNKMIDCDSDGVLCASEPMKISVEENIAIYGGKVVFDYEKGNGTYSWDFSDEFIKDVYAMWSVCKENPSGWNAQIHALDKLCIKLIDTENLSFSVSLGQIRGILTEKEEKLILNSKILKRLNDSGIINSLAIDKRGINFSFKNHQVKKCLTKAGQILELAIAVAAIETDDENGERCYNDVLTGVCIDWDGEIQPEFKPDVENEIDVILMKGMVPVFISCKNGLVTMDELYKLSIVADRFGGKFAGKVLVTSDLEKAGQNEPYIKARAEIMGIKISDNVDELSVAELKNKIRNMWRIE